MAKIIKLIKSHFVIFLVLAISIPILSYKLLEVPRGLTVDEAAFGYNATLLANTLHDENGRFLPVFVLSDHGRDWRQPITQYYQAIFFKLFGASVFNLRFSSIIITIFTAILIYFLSLYLIKSKIWANIASLVYLTIPIVVIQARYGLDNHMTVPFTILWLLGLFLFSDTKKTKWLFVSAISLGIAFYTYKGMRAVVPIWSIISFFYILKVSTIKSTIKFTLFLLPFFAIIPLLETKYAGAVFNGQGFSPMTYYNFFYPYISTFDPSFLFITGDATPFHSTSHHGMFLLFSLPLFATGLYLSLKMNYKYKYLLLTFFSAPLLMGFVNSVHRASRVMCLVPVFVVFSTIGLKYIWNISKYSKLISILLIGLIVYNFYDFYHFYHNDYAKITESLFGNQNYYVSFNALRLDSQKYTLKPAIDKVVYDNFGNTGDFYQAIYFPKGLDIYSDINIIPQDALFMSQRKDIPGFTQVSQSQNFFFHQRNK